MLLQGVPPICLQLRTKSWKLKNHIRQKISPVLKFLNKKLLDGILKLGKIKFKVFLNWISKKNVKSEKWFCTLPPQLIMPAAPLPPGKKKILHPATSIDNASSTPTPWQNFFLHPATSADNAFLHPYTLAITASFLCMLKYPFLHSVEIG